MNAQFILPDFYTGMPMYACLCKISKQYPEILIPNTEIYTIFGIFPACIWNGGGISNSGSVDAGQIKDYIDFYNFELGISLSFTFTNPLINEMQCFDTYGNIIAELGNNGHNKILVCEGPLEEYLRKNYKKYKYCRSIVDSENIPYKFESKYGEYDLAVLQRIKNNNWDYLNSIPVEKRDKIEILCNDPCPDDCSYIYGHYQSMAQRQLKLQSLELDECKMRKIKGFFPEHYTQTQLSTYISREMIDKQYLPTGFTKFKCSGRWSKSMILLNLLNYIIKPEYHDDMLIKLLDA